MKHRISRLIEILQQGSSLVASMTDLHYCAGDDGPWGGSVGAHLRHILDHCHSFLAGQESGRVNYDQRVRGTIVERDRSAGMEAIERTCAALAARTVSRSLEVFVAGEGSHPDAWVPSSSHRELEFLVSHTIHHYAIIARICRAEGVDVAVNFGVAPSTIRYRTGLDVPHAS